MSVVDDCPVCQPDPEPGRAPNRPNLTEVAYRLGTFGTFRARLLRNLSRDPALAGLSTYDADDHIVSMIEMWAAIADVLCFHTERYANEAWLGTLTDPDSAASIVELIGAEARPGLAAVAWLAFTADPDTLLTVPAGLRVQSVPPAGELPQTFETMDDLRLDARLNRLTAYPADPRRPSFAGGADHVVLAATTAPATGARLRPGQKLALVGSLSDAFELASVRALERDEVHVVVRFESALRGTAGTAPKAYLVDRFLPVFGRAVPDRWTVPGGTGAKGDPVVWTVVNRTNATTAVPTGRRILLDGTQDIATGARVLVLVPGSKPVVTAVRSVEPTTAQVGPLSGPCTALGVVKTLPAHDRRTVQVLLLDGPRIRGEGTTPAPQPLGADLFVPAFGLPDRAGGPAVEMGARIVGAAWEAGVPIALDEIGVGRRLLVALDGASVDPPPPRVATVDGSAEVLAPQGPGEATFVRIPIAWAEPLPATASVLTVLGNVAQASHGESVTEVVGSGDATRPFQRFTLSKAPLTHLLPTSGTAPEPVLRVFVDGVERPRVPTLYGAPPSAEVVVVRQRPDGLTELLGGDGLTGGARFPSGAGNIVARYRVGTGLVGRVPAGSLTTPLGAPPGVAKVVNLLPAVGGADAEDVAALRRSAPARVRTLGRAVSLRDLEDVAYDTGLVAKALATWVWSGFERLPHLSVATHAGGPLTRDLLDGLAAAVNRVRDPSFALRIDAAVRIPVRVRVVIAVDPAYADANAVIAGARDAIATLLSFDRVTLGGSVNLGDVMAAVAGAPGVVGAIVEELRFVTVPTHPAARGLRIRGDGSVHPVQHRLCLLPAVPDPLRPGRVIPAEFASLDTGHDLEVAGGLA